MKKTLSKLKIIFRQPFYRNVALVTSLITALLSYWLLSQTTSVQAFIEMTQRGEFGKYSYLYSTTYIITTLLIIGLSGISAAVIFWLFKHSKLSNGKTFGTNLGGFVVGMAGMGCPICGAFLLSFIGLAGGLTLLPLQGIELKFLSLALIAGPTMYSIRRVSEAHDCLDCHDIERRHVVQTIPVAALRGQGIQILPVEKIITSILIVAFLVNQLLISSTSVATGASSSAGFVGALFGIKTASAATIIAPKLNPDGRTTSLVEQPTITEVLANPNTGDALADAKVVMQATGKPFYAPDDISFDDPINAQKKWGAYESSITLSSDLEARHQKLISTMVCSYCCGGPTSVATINRCGCAHAKAVRGMFKFLLQGYGSKYSDDQLLGEAHRWYAIWYPKGMLEDYLLATGKSDALPHKTHGGAGSDGKHGL